MTTSDIDEVRRQIVATVREFVQKDVVPQAAEHDENDTYPTELVEQMAEMGLFGITIPEEYGGMGLDYTTYAMVFEELCKGWMSITAPIGTHSILTAAIVNYGTEEQKREWLPKLASGEKRGGLALTEPGGGSAVASLQTTAVRDGEEYIVNGNKLFITKGLLTNLRKFHIAFPYRSAHLNDKPRNQYG